MALNIDHSQAPDDADESRFASMPAAMRAVRLAPVVLALMMAVAPSALARRPAWAVGVNIGASRASKDGTSKDFGVALSYLPLSWLGVRAGYESVTAYEMTLAELTAVASVPLSARLRLIAMAGGAHWSESPNGRGGAHGFNPLVAAGLSYRLARPWGVRLQYQYIIGHGALTQSLRSVLLSIRYRL